MIFIFETLKYHIILIYGAQVFDECSYHFIYVVIQVFIFKFLWEIQKELVELLLLLVKNKIICFDPYPKLSFHLLTKLIKSEN
jgi:hypothetical protein